MFYSSDSRRAAATMIVIVLLAASAPRLTSSVSVPLGASSLCQEERQPDGTVTPELCLNGDESCPYWTHAVPLERNGVDLYATAEYTVVRDGRWFVYVDPSGGPNATTGDIVERTNEAGALPPPLALRVTADSDPVALGLPPDLPALCEEPAVAAGAQGGFRSAFNVGAEVGPSRFIGRGRILVLPVRFSDHKSRSLPSVSDLNDFFNHVGPHLLAPGGSVRDFFLSNSFGQFDLRAVVAPRWINLPKSERYYADGDMGRTGKMKEALPYAMETIDSTMPGFDFAKAGGGEGDFLGVVMMHSGFGAAWGGEDCDNKTPHLDRIWSAAWPVFQQGWVRPSTGEMVLKPGVWASQVTSLWHICGNTINKLGPAVHEIGHMMGMLDVMGGGDKGRGVGLHDSMGSAWGFHLHTESPTTLSAYHKIKLGWLEPIVLDETSGGRYDVPASESHAVAYKVTAGFPDGEYLLIENRQPVGFDAYIGPGGLAIWHVDETRSYRDEEGFPGRRGWLKNGVHSRLTLLQADGRYHMERAENDGDANDYWRNKGPISVAATRARLRGGGKFRRGGPFPNTDSYQGSGMPERTGIRIQDISRSKATMKFTFSYSARDRGQSPGSVGQKNAHATRQRENSRRNEITDILVEDEEPHVRTRHRIGSQ